MKTSEIKKIYVAEYNGNFKIGVSKNISLRMRQLSCGCPTIKSVYESDYLSNAFELESVLHNLYKDKNVGGEWFLSVDINEISKIIQKHGKIESYEKCKKEEIERTKKNLIVWKDDCNNHFSVLTNNSEEDIRNMPAEELRYENEQISKFTIAVSGADVPNIYSDLIYGVLFGKDTRQLVAEYKTSMFESFRKHLSEEQNSSIRKYTYMIGNMINAYWNFDKIKNCMEMI